MNKPIEQVFSDLQDQVVAQVLGADVTLAELSAAFVRVQDVAHWKNPIDVTVTLASGGKTWGAH